MVIQEITRAIEDAVMRANTLTIHSAIYNLDQDYNFNDLRIQLDTLPSDIYNQRIKINSYRNQQRNLIKELKEKENTLKSLENDLLLVITAETNPDTGKPVYSNDKARQAELNNRKKTDPDYLAIDNQIRQIRAQNDDLENQIAMAEAELERLQNTFTAVTKKIELASREMALAASAMSTVSLMGQHQSIDTGSSVAGQAEGWDD
jgi:chromosome segregation ATPase